MNLLKKLADWVAPDEDHGVYKRVESLKREVNEDYAEKKAEQKQSLIVAAEQTDDHLERKKLERFVSLVSEQEREARLEVEARKNRLQTLVNIQTRSH